MTTCKRVSYIIGSTGFEYCFLKSSLKVERLEDRCIPLEQLCALRCLRLKLYVNSKFEDDSQHSLGVVIESFAQSLTGLLFEGDPRVGKPSNVVFIKCLEGEIQVASG